MMASSRKTRNYKERRTMFAFGQLVLPLAALIALGMLFMGIKFFFLTPSGRDDKASNVVAVTEPVDMPETKPADVPPEQSKAIQTTPAAPQPTQAQKMQTAPAQQVQQKKPQGTKIVLAEPVNPATESSAKNAKNTKSAASTTKSAQQSTAAKKPAAGAVVKKTEPAKTATTVKATTTAKTDNKQIASKTDNKPVVSKAETPTKSPTNTTTTKGAWAVQIGAFSKKEGADEIAAKAKKEGYATSVSLMEREGTTMYRVRVKLAGTTREDAAKLATELEQKGYPVAIVAE